jgi:pilus assembly protein CpaE
MTPRVKVWLAGDWDEAGELRAASAAASEALVVEAGEAEVVVCVGQEGADMQDIAAAVRERSQAPLIVLAAAIAPGLLESALAADIAEVMILPQPPEAVVFAAQKLIAERPRAAAAGDARVVTVFSPKGGTGKSAVSCNLAAAFAAEGKRALLVDLDLQFGDVAIMLGLQPERTLHDLLATPGPLDADKIAGYATRHRSGVHVLPAPLRPEDAELITDARVTELIDAARSGYDVVVVDTAPFFQGSVLAALDRTDALLLLTAPDVPTMKNVRLALQTLDLLSFPAERTRIVLNRASARIGFRSPQVATVLEREVAFELPEDETVAIAVNRGTPAVLFKPNSPFSTALTAAAAALDEGAAAPAARRTRRFAIGRRS